MRVIGPIDHAFSGEGHVLTRLRPKQEVVGKWKQTDGDCTCPSIFQFMFSRSTNLRHVIVETADFVFGSDSYLSEAESFAEYSDSPPLKLPACDSTNSDGARC